MLTWLYRPQCAACRELSSEPLCSSCALSLLEASEPGPTGALERVVAPWRYGGALATAIRRLKFTGATDVARTVAPLWSPLVAAAIAELGTGALVVPVPLHWRRRVYRGFDQAWLLASHACAHASVARPSIVLRRVRSAPPQSTLSAAERVANLVDAFAVPDERAVAERPIILVDDVVTTGATLAAAAEPLLRAGATRVVGIALARTE